MSALLRVLGAEALKAWRAKVPWITAVAMSLGPLAGALFLVILKDPERARRMGLLGAKAQIMGAADWSGHLAMLSQVVGVGGLIVFAFVAAWVFGREYAGGTLHQLLAVPTPRSAIVWAKLAVIAAWSAALAVEVFALGVGLGALVGIPGYGHAVLLRAAGHFAVTTLLTVCLLPPVALLASMGRGYLVPLGYALFTVFLSQIAAALGWGTWMPWAVPALFAGIAGPEGEVPHAGSYALVVATGLVGILGTLAWWRWADQD